MSSEKIQIPRFYRPFPYQVGAWKRRQSGKYTYYFKLWARQLGKDTDDMQHALKYAWDNPGTQTAYIGLDNVWITNNIFKKYIDNRLHWDDYPPELIDVKDTAKEVYLLNNDGEAPSRIKFIGFLNDKGIIGSSYDNFYISEASLYPRNGFQYVRPIWDRKIKFGAKLGVNFNGTPRGVKNVLYDLLRLYTGMEDPEDFPGDHGNCYVDKVTIEDAMIFNEEGKLVPMYSKEEIEELRLHYIREFGNDALFRQENFCDFTAVNAGLVYRGVEVLVREKRYTQIGLDTHKPVYVAYDIASKGKETDSTAAIIYQYYNNRMIIYDTYEARGVSLVEAVSDLAKRDYFHLIRAGFLPWDSERSASSQTPIEEARQMFPNINWHSLDKERVDRGIQLVREQLPNMLINNNSGGDRLLECLNNYEYKRLERSDDWSAKPAHSKFSHMADALRYAAMGISELKYYGYNEDGSENLDWNQSYSDSWNKAEKRWDKPYPEHWVKKPKEENDGLSYR